MSYQPHWQYHHFLLLLFPFPPFYCQNTLIIFNIFYKEDYVPLVCWWEMEQADWKERIDDYITEFNDLFAISFYLFSDNLLHSDLNKWSRFWRKKETVLTAGMVYCPAVRRRSCCLWGVGREARSPGGWRKLPGWAGWGSDPLLGRGSPRQWTRPAFAPPKAKHK